MGLHVNSLGHEQIGCYRGGGAGPGQNGGDQIDYYFFEGRNWVDQIDYYFLAWLET